MTAADATLHPSSSGAFSSPPVDPRAWNDWRWQVRHRVRSVAELEARLALPEPLRAKLAAASRGAAGPESVEARFPAGVSPYYLSLADLRDPADPILLQVLPLAGEAETAPGTSPDPFEEDRLSPVPGVVHRYPDRALIVPTNFCATLCRHCFRKRTWADGFFVLDERALDAAVAYVAARPAVRDVLITGGDPLHVPEQRLERLLAGLRAVPHVEVLRVASRTPVTLPQRLDPPMLDLLARHRPLWFITHFNHAREVSPAAETALRALLDRGITVQNQAVLLRGVNDSTGAQVALSRALLKVGVRPYYLHLADPVAGTAHFRVSIDRGLEIVRGMVGRIAGLGVPRLVVDLPGGRGKVPLVPDFTVARDGDDVWFQSPIDGGAVRYPNPPDRAPQ